MEVWRRYANATVLQQKIDDVEVRAPEMLEGITPRTFRVRLQGDRFAVTKRHGKYLFLGLKGGSWVTLHFGMTGFLKYFRDPERAPPHTRLLVTFSNGFHLAYDCQRKLGMVALLEDPGSLVRRKGLGVDALDPGLGLSDIKRLLAGKRTRIKTALMDQHLIAGIGNIYSDEILFQSRVHPGCPARDLDEAGHKVLFRSLRQLLRMAIRCTADPGRLPPTWLLLSRHPGGTCPTCGAALTGVRLSGRSCYFCANCQRRGANIHASW